MVKLKYIKPIFVKLIQYEVFFIKLFDNMSQKYLIYYNKRLKEYERHIKTGVDDQKSSHYISRLEGNF